MATKEEINQQQTLLLQYRRNLALLLGQQVLQGGKVYVLPATVNGIREAREEIRRIKAALHGWGVAVEDQPDELTVQEASIAYSHKADKPAPADDDKLSRVAIPAKEETSNASHLPSIDSNFIASLEDPGGGMSLDSTFYIERKADEILRRNLSKPRGCTIIISAPRITGKTSLLLRGIAHARTQGSKTIFIDMQPINHDFLQNLDIFLRYFSIDIVTRLGLDVRMADQMWANSMSASNKITQLMEEYVLPQITTKLVLAVDETDRILGSPIHNNFFGILRSWHNKRSISEQWNKLDILLTLSTETYLLITDLDQSPFNIGTEVNLDDFSEAEIRTLNMRYRLPFSQQDLGELLDLLGGHPYLTNKAMYIIVTEELTWDKLKKVASANRGPFSDHLRRYWWLLRENPLLINALKQVIEHGRCSDHQAYFRLFQAGLIKGSDDTSCTIRCKLYELYLKDKL